MRRSKNRLPSLTAITVAAAVALLRPITCGADESLPFGNQFSVASDFAQPPLQFTLLDPAWLLPPIETLDLALPSADSTARAEQILHDDIDAASAPAERPSPSDGKVGYSLSDDLTAQVGYEHARLSDRSNSQTLRTDAWSSFSTRPDRDVVDLIMSWRLRGNTVGLGYQFQSDRLGAAAGEGGVSRFLPGSPQATHALTLGLTREWGADRPPAVLVDVPVLEPVLAEASGEATPTPPR